MPSIRAFSITRELVPVTHHGTLTVPSAVGRSKLLHGHFACGAGYGVLPVLSLILYIGSFSFDLHVYRIITRTRILFLNVSFAGIGRETEPSRARSGSIRIEYFLFFNVLDAIRCSFSLLYFITTNWPVCRFLGPGFGLILVIEKSCWYSRLNLTRLYRV